MITAAAALIRASIEERIRSNLREASAGAAGGAPMSAESSAPATGGIEVYATRMSLTRSATCGAASRPSPARRASMALFVEVVRVVHLIRANVVVAHRDTASSEESEESEESARCRCGQSPMLERLHRLVALAQDRGGLRDGPVGRQRAAAARRVDRATARSTAAGCARARGWRGPRSRRRRLTLPAPGPVGPPSTRRRRRRTSSTAAWCAIVKIHDRNRSSSPRNVWIVRNARRNTSLASPSGSLTRRAREVARRPARRACGTTSRTLATLRPAPA